MAEAIYPRVTVDVFIRIGEGELHKVGELTVTDTFDKSLSIADGFRAIADEIDSVGLS